MGSFSASKYIVKLKTYHHIVFFFFFKLKETGWSGGPKTTSHLKRRLPEDFLGGSVVENLSANAEDTGLIPGLGRSHKL